MQQATPCSNCSNLLSESQNFCQKCGQRRPQPSKEQAIDEAVKHIQSRRMGRLGRKRELKELHKVLWEDELPEQIVSGDYKGNSGILVATDRRIIFMDKGLLGQVKMTDFWYPSISSFESSKGIVFGHITLYASGHNVEFGNILKEEVDDFVMEQRNKLSQLKAHAAPATTHSTPPQSSSLGEDLAKLGQLHRDGTLTDEEFERAKQRLIDRG